ncbi:MAG: SufD family Fe-S cluster assembly protein [Candidatus Anstonellaceae archaeon]
MKMPLNQQAEAISSFLGEPEWIRAKRLQAVQLLQKRKGRGEVEGFRMEKGDVSVSAECEGRCRVLSFEEAISEGNALKEQLSRPFDRQAPDNYLLSFALFTDAAVVACGEGKNKARIRYSGRPSEYFAWFFLFEDAAEAEIIFESTIQSDVSDCRSFFVGQKAKLELAMIHQEAEASKIEIANVFLLGKTSQVKIFDFDLGASERLHKEVIFQEKEESRCERHGLSVMAGKQNFKKEIQINHLARNTFSRTNLKHICSGSSNSYVEGKVFISQDAEDADAFFLARSLLASSQATSKLSPQIFVHNNQVNASHGSSVFSFDPDWLFYLQSRGLPEIEAKKAVIEGFGMEILGKASQFVFKNAETKILEKIELACKEVEYD